VLGVRADHQAYAEAVVERLKAAGIRTDTVVADEPLGARIRRAKLEKLPYVLVVGDDDIVAAGDDDVITGDAADGTAATVGVNPRGGDVERGVTVADVLARLDAEVEPYRVIGV
jgi:threonyl-tRNA synthetase